MSEALVEAANGAISPAKTRTKPSLGNGLTGLGNVGIVQSSSNLIIRETGTTTKRRTVNHHKTKSDPASIFASNIISSVISTN